jgi:hypothetical protein
VKREQNDPTTAARLLLVLAATACATVPGIPAPPIHSPWQTTQPETGRDRADRRRRARHIAATEGRDVEEVYQWLGRGGER